MTKYHMCQSVRGALKNWSGKQWEDALEWMTHDDGKRFPSGEALEFVFQQMLEQGIEVIPLGECDNFDPKTGCKGHPVLIPQDTGGGS